MAERRILAARNAKEAVKAGFEPAAITSIPTAIPTVLAASLMPWAKSNLDPTAQALFVSLVGGAAYFIVADQQTLPNARASSYQRRMHHS